MAVLAVTACTGDSGVKVERVHVEPSGAMSLEPKIVAAGSSLVGIRGTDYNHPNDLGISTDLGATWRSVDLPGAPAGDLAFAGPTTRGDLVVVTARDHGETGLPGSLVPHGRAYAWVTRDGIEWRGGLVADEGAVLSELHVFEVDGILFAPFPSRRALVVHRSRDYGASWDRTDVEGLAFDGSYLDTSADSATFTAVWRDGKRLYARVDFNSSRRPGGRAVSLDGGATWRFEACSRRQCPVPPMQAGTLLVGGASVSIDGGASWQYALTKGKEWFDDVQAVPGGSWLAIASRSAPTEDSGPVPRVMRSDDGMHWRTLAEDRCVRRNAYEHKGTFHEPVPFGDGWLIAYTCGHHEEPTGYYGDVFVTDRGARSLTRVGDAHIEGAEYAQPVRVDDRVVIPEHEDAGAPISSFLVLTP
jgi:hypothetical protein